MTSGLTLTVNRDRLPQAGPARPVTFPAIDKSTLASGLRVWTVRHPQVPLVAFLVLVRRGAASDPPGKDGLAALTADMLDEGSTGRTSIEMHEALGRIGAQFDMDIGSDAMLASVTALSRVADRALTIVADMVARPTLAEADFARVRQLRLHRLAQLRDNPAAVADRAFISLLYASHPYGHTPMGSDAALASMTVDDARAFHRASIRPGTTTIVAVGDCAHDEIVRLAEAAFAGWDGAAGPEPEAAGALPKPARIAVVPRGSAPQSELRIGHVAVARDTPDYHALVAGNMVLGGQFVSRMNLNLREHRGFTYGARTSFDFRRLPGPFALQVSVQTNATSEAIAEAIGEIDAIRGARPITRDELQLGAAALTRGYARNFETADQIARAVVQLALYNLPDDYFAAFVPTIERLTPEAVTSALARHVDPGRLATLVVGDFDAFGPTLSQLGFGEPVVLPADTF
jgi:predicted Zn-dependent peptidase